MFVIYIPMFKMNKLKEDLEDRFKKAFIPGYASSLDKTLIHSFGRIQFKVRIVTKSA